MRSSLILFSFFIGGLIIGKFFHLPPTLLENNLELYMLYILLVFIGINIGSDKETLSNLFKIDWRLLLVPLFIVIGSLGGSALVSLLLKNIDLREGLAVGAGLGYYSLSSILITQISGEELGIIALLSNIFRETATILMAPVLVKLFGKLSPIASGGATTMDITLPTIITHSGHKYTVIAIVSGLVLSFVVPVLIPILLA